MARVLVVDDDTRVLGAAADALEALGHSPIACGDEAAALGLSPEVIGAIDLALVDVHFPDRPAGHLIRVLAERYPGLPLVAMSGESVTGGLPTVGFLAKPFSLADLRRVVADRESAGPADSAVDPPADPAVDPPADPPADSPADPAADSPADSPADPRVEPRPSPSPVLLSAERVSRRLHDEVSQPLVGARLAADLVLAGHGDPREALERIAPALAESLDALRRLLHDLSGGREAR